MDSNDKLKEAVATVCEAIRTDEGYKISWVANIAMAFKDEYARYTQTKSEYEVIMVIISQFTPTPKMKTKESEELKTELKIMNVAAKNKLNLDTYLDYRAVFSMLGYVKQVPKDEILGD